MNVREFLAVRDMVNDPMNDLCHHDAVAQYVFDVYGLVHGVDGSRLVDIDWASWTRIITYITDRFMELGRRDSGEDFELMVRDVSEYRETDFGYELRDGDDVVARIYRCEHDGTECGWYVYQGWECFGRGDTPQEALDNMRVCPEGVEHYAIEDGEIHYYGYNAYSDENGYQFTEVDFCYLPIADYTEDNLMREAESCNQCSWDADSMELNDDAHLPLHEVNEGTPNGFYWCLTSEM